MAQLLNLLIFSLLPQIKGIILMTVNSTQSRFIGLIQQTPVTIGNVSILTTFIIVEEISYKMIFSEL